MSNCLDVLFRFAPNHIPSVLLLLISSPEHFWNAFSSLNRFSADSRSETKTVVSSAYCEILNFLSKILIPLIVLSCLIALASISAHSTKRAPESGHPSPYASLKFKELRCVSVVHNAARTVIVESFYPPYNLRPEI